MNQYATNKGHAEDLTEGKFSFPIIHGVNKNPADRELLSESSYKLCRTMPDDLFPDILQKRPSSPTLKDHAIDYLDHISDSFQYTHSVLEKIERQIRDELIKLGGNSILEAILHMLTNTE